jgi:hypothetical protein
MVSFLTIDNAHHSDIPYLPPGEVLEQLCELSPVNCHHNAMEYYAFKHMN